LVLGLLSRRETVGTKSHLAENRLYVILEHFVHPAVTRMSYPFWIAASIEVPLPANDGIEEAVNHKVHCALLQLFARKPEEPVSALFRQKAA
jgi:hypothetical protein